MQLAQPGRVEHRHRTLDATGPEHVGCIRADRAWRAIRQLHYQQQHAVPALKRPRCQHTPEKRMRLRRNSHFAGQDRTHLLQSVAFTPGTGKTHLAIGLAIRACQAGHRVLFATAAEWVARLAEAHHAGRLQQELIRLGRYPLLVIDEVGYIPFEPEAANLFFQLVSSRYERASLIVTSNKPFGKAHLFARTCVEVAPKRDTFAPVRVHRTDLAVGHRRGGRRGRSSPLRASSRMLPRQVSGRSY